MADVRPIDANTVITIQVFDEMTEEYTMQTMTIAEMIDRWADEGCPPTISAVPVVRCKECIHYVKKDDMTPGENRMRCDHPDLDYDIECYDQWLDVEPDGFCHKGAKMDGGAEG